MVVVAADAVAVAVTDAVPAVAPLSPRRPLGSPIVPSLGFLKAYIADAMSTT